MDAEEADGRPSPAGSTSGTDVGRRREGCGERRKSGARPDPDRVWGSTKDLGCRRREASGAGSAQGCRRPPGAPLGYRRGRGGQPVDERSPAPRVVPVVGQACRTAVQIVARGEDARGCSRSRGPQVHARGRRRREVRRSTRQGGENPGEKEGEPRQTAHAKGIAPASVDVNAPAGPHLASMTRCASSAVRVGFSCSMPRAPHITPNRSVLSITPRFPGSNPAPCSVTGTKLAV